MRFPLRHRYSGLFAVLALAVMGWSPAARALGPAGDAFFGYSHLGNDAFYTNAGGLEGWEGAVNLQLKPLLGAFR